MTLDELRRLLPGLPTLLGLTVTRAEKDIVTATLLVRPEICTLGDTIHGGAIMAFADTVGAIGTVINLGPGQGTTTIESKTNFVAAAPVGLFGEQTNSSLFAGCHWPRMSSTGSAKSLA